MEPIAAVILLALALAVAVLLIVFVVTPIFAMIARFVRHIFRFIGGMIGDCLRAIGAIIATIVLAPLIAGSVIIGRWSAASHFGRAIQNEIGVFGHCCYRVLLGHPARLLGLAALTEGIEQRIPEAVAKTPGSDKPSKRTGQFEGYSIVGSLPGGGSGARIYVAQPDEKKLATFARAGHTAIDQVVIKSFSVHDGSSLPQIIRESRALEAAKNLGLVLDHELNEHRFFYVMPYVPGEDLSTTTRKLHDASGAEGLGRRQLDEALRYIADLLETLNRYHRGGLWHKDVKPDNIIVHNRHAHLVDLGLVTPMRSAMTLTTHGTEYFRDPEMVRMALRGVKVHEVDGAKFDLYAAGAVLYSIIENSFPAHGGLSQVSKKCPDSLRLVIRRAMSDYNSRYGSAPEMLADLRTIMTAADPFAVKPADLPSMRQETAEAVAAVEEELVASAARPAATPVAGPAFQGAAAHFGAADAARDTGRRRPHLNVTSWWTGRYIVSGEESVPPSRGGVRHYAANVGPVGVEVKAGVKHRTPRPGSLGTAQEQRERARARAHAARQRAQERMRRRANDARFDNNPNTGVYVGLAVVGAIVVGGVALLGRPGEFVREAFDGGFSPRVEINHDGETIEILTSAPGAGTTITKLAQDKAAPPVEGELLVIDDLTAAQPVLREAIVARMSANAAGLGYHLLVRGDDPEFEDLEAKARAYFGTPPADANDPAFRTRVLEWVRAQPESLRGVVRLYWEGAAKDQRPAAQIFAPSVDGAWLLRQLQRD